MIYIYDFIFIGLELQRQDRIERIGLQNTSGINSASSISFNESSATSGTRAIKNSASEGDYSSNLMEL